MLSDHAKTRLENSVGIYDRSPQMSSGISSLIIQIRGVVYRNQGFNFPQSFLRMSSTHAIDPIHIVLHCSRKTCHIYNVYFEIEGIL